MRRTKLNSLDEKVVKLLCDNFTKAQLKEIMNEADHYEIFLMAWKEKA